MSAWRYCWGKAYDTAVQGVFEILFPPLVKAHVHSQPPNKRSEVLYVSVLIRFFLRLYLVVSFCALPPFVSLNMFS